MPTSTALPRTAGSVANPNRTRLASDGDPVSSRPTSPGTDGEDQRPQP